MSIEFLWLGTGVTLLSFVLCALVRRFAHVLRLIDVPNARSSHAAPTPRGGGIGIVLSIFVGLAVAQWLDLAIPPAAPMILIVGGGAVAGVSLLDDLRGVAPQLRLTIHLAAAAFVVALCGPMFEIDVPVIGPVHFGWAAAPLTVLWVAGMTNAYNFMDGVDGLAGGQAVTAAAAWVVVGWSLGGYGLMTIGALLFGASAGFLLHNWSPARLFMGDVGSAFLGFSFAVLPLLATELRAQFAFWAVVVLWPFVFDPAYTLVRRISRGENLLQAHRSHLYQRLVAAGSEHRAVCLLYVSIAFAGSAIGVAALTEVTGAAVLLLLYLPGSVLFVAGLANGFFD